MFLLFSFFQKVVFLVFFQRLTQNLTLNLSGINLNGPPEMTEDESDGDDADTLPIEDTDVDADLQNKNTPLRSASSAPALCFDPEPSTSTPAPDKVTPTQNGKSSFTLAQVTHPLVALKEAAVGTITRSARKKLDLKKKELEEQDQNKEQHE